MNDSSENNEEYKNQLEDFEETLQELKKLGLIKEENGNWKLTEKGEYYVR